MEDFLKFEDVTFAYPIVEGDLDENGNQRMPKNVFEHFSAQLPGGFVSFVGQNGVGKSTLLLLACGRLKPLSGKVSLFGKDLFLLDETQKNLLASVVYQNMEFESEESVDELLTQVYKNGNFASNAKAIRSNGDLKEEVIETFELQNVLNRSLTKLSKGEIQRVLLAFSVLYGSRAIFMDEPLFALEDAQKENALSYLKDFSKTKGISVYISMHELFLTKKFAENVLLFYPNHDMAFGSPEEVLTDEELEKAYQIPVAMLKQKEDLTRAKLNEEAQFS